MISFPPILAKSSCKIMLANMSTPSTDSLYTRLRVIGKGSYGEVWLVKHKKDKKQYVLKKMDIHNASKRERKAAEQEAKLLSKLKHPNIVSYKDSFQGDDGFLYIAMGHCEGGDLYTRLKEQKGVALEERQVVEWFVQIAMALQYIHERNILHRDLKTQNIFLTKSKIIKVGDLGIARVLDSSSDMATTLIGTPYYMSPELFSNKPYNHKSDVWALGCCVYEMSTLKHAFNARDMNALVYKILRGRMPAMPRQYSPELTLLIRAMLSQNPDRRPSVNRILRDPYIKKNIAIFLEGTKKSRTGSASRVRSSGPRRSSDEGGRLPQSSRRSSEADLTDGPETARSSASSVSSVGDACRVYEAASTEQAVDRSLEPLNIGPELEPIAEETSPDVTPRVHHKKCNPTEKRTNSVLNARTKAQTKESDNVKPGPESCFDSNVTSADNVKSPVENCRHPRLSPQNDVSRQSKRNCVLTDDASNSEKMNGKQTCKNQRDAHLSKPFCSVQRLPPRRKRQNRGVSDNRIAHVDVLSKQPHRESDPAPARSVLDHPKVSVETPRPLPPRPTSDGTPQSSSSNPKRSHPGGPNESGYSSASSMVCVSKETRTGGDTQPQQTPRGLNLSARERRRQKKDIETPRTSRSVEIERSNKEGQSRVTKSVNSGLDVKKERPISRTEAAPVVCVSEKRVKHRQPSLTQESSSSDSEDGPDAEKKKENRRTDREMNNFISLLDTTLKLNKESRSDTEDVDKTDNSDDTLTSGTVVEADVDNVDATEASSGPAVDVSRVQSSGDAKASTLTTTGRLWERIALLRKDCIHGLGVVKLKQAYDILDEFEAEELEPQLIALLGQYNFDIYAGKIWQLKFCEEAAFGFS